nr:thiol protease aleurain [Ipomoea batatas]
MPSSLMIIRSGKSYQTAYMSWRAQFSKSSVPLVMLPASLTRLLYKLGVNEFADMTWNEFQNTIGALEAAYVQAFRKNISLSEQQLVDCAGAFNNIGCNGGLPSQAFEYIKYNGGHDTEEAYPYTGENGVCNYSSENVGVRVFESVNITLGAEDELKYAVGLIRLCKMAPPIGSSRTHGEKTEVTMGTSKWRWERTCVVLQLVLHFLPLHECYSCYLSTSLGGLRMQSISSHNKEPTLWLIRKIQP